MLEHWLLGIQHSIFWYLSKISIAEYPTENLSKCIWLQNRITGRKWEQAGFFSSSTIIMEIGNSTLLSMRVHSIEIRTLYGWNLARICFLLLFNEGWRVKCTCRFMILYIRWKTQELRGSLCRQDRNDCRWPKNNQNIGSLWATDHIKVWCSGCNSESIRVFSHSSVDTSPVES